jgi:hypothetical protein
MNDQEPPLTVKEQVSLALKLPNTGRQWLNEYIDEARRMDLAQAAACSMASKLKTPDGSPMGVDPSAHQRLVQRAEEYIWDHIPEAKAQ